MLKILIVCDTNRAFSPLVGAILQRICQERHLPAPSITTRGTLAGHDQRPLFEPLVSYAISQSVFIPIQPATDLDAMTFHNSQLKIICDPNSLELITQLYGLDNQELFYLPRYYQKQLFRRLPDPILGEIDIPSFFALIQEATTLLFKQELAGKMQFSELN